MMTSSNGNISRVTSHLCGEFTGDWWNPRHKGQWRGALMFSLICAWINGWVNNRGAGELSRHRAHYDVIVIRGTAVISERYFNTGICTFQQWKSLLVSILTVVAFHKSYIEYVSEMVEQAAHYILPVPTDMRVRHSFNVWHLKYL